MNSDELRKIRKQQQQDQLYKDTEALRKRIEAQVADYLANGGDITQVRPGQQTEAARAERADSSRMRWTKDTKLTTVFTRSVMRQKE